MQNYGETAPLMPVTGITPPFAAYRGDKPYIFVSYAHENKQAVYPELSRLNKSKFRVWYDEGIDGGEDWRKIIANAIDKSSLVLVFISPESVASEEVNREINFALNQRKKLVAVHLVITALPLELQLALGGIQALQLYSLEPDDYVRRLLRSLPSCLREATPNDVETTQVWLSSDRAAATQPSAQPLKVPAAPLLSPESVSAPADTDRRSVFAGTHRAKMLVPSLVAVPFATVAMFVNALWQQGEFALTPTPTVRQDTARPLVSPGPESQRRFHGHSADVRTVTFSGDGQLVISGGADATIRVWNPTTGDQVQTLGFGAQVQSLALSPSGRLLAAGGGDSSIKIIDTVTWKETQTFPGLASQVIGISFGAKDDAIAYAASDQILRVRSLQSGQQPKTMTGHNNGVTSVAVSPDGRLAASGSLDKTVRIWSLETGNTVRTLVGHQDWVWAVAFSPDGQYVASGSADKTVKVWDVAAGTPLWTVAHTDRVHAVKFSIDGNSLISGSADRTSRLWDVGSGRQIIRHSHDGGVNAISISPDGQWLAAGLANGTVDLVQLPN